MFDKLTLTNFRKIESEVLDFGRGLILFKGANEAGKSSRLSAIVYALFGARSLPQPLSEVVTWGKPESSLAVELVFTFDGVTYTITRKKSGAELTYTGGIVTGQTEVTKFCETLLGTTADTAAKMMLASQGSLRGALSGGPSEAAALIETLADFNLIDRIVEMVQHELPTGATKDIESQLGTLACQLETTMVEPLDTAAMEIEIDALNTRMGAAYEEQKTKSTELSALALGDARKALVDAAAGLRDAEQVMARIRGLTPAATRLLIQPTTTQEQVEEWRKALFSRVQEDTALAAHTALHALPMPEMVWAGSRDSLAEALKAALQNVNSLIAENNRLLTRRATVVAGLVKEQTCAFCDKDLASVPEVVQRNIQVNAEVATIDIELLAHETAYAGTKAEYDDLLLLDQQATAYERAVGKYSAYIDIVDDQVPHSWKWKGTVPQAAGDRPAYAEMVSRAEAEHRAYISSAADKVASERQLKALQDQLAALQADQQALDAAAVLAKGRLDAGDALEHRVRVLGDEIRDVKTALDAKRVEMEHKMQLHAQRVQQRHTLQVQLDTARARLEAMNRNNALIKKLRGARPAISDKLWTIVLASVSHYFSEIRGVVTVVTRTDGGFKADGQAVAGLSGSTLDALGLAIRIALTKTFLPNARFLLTDEPAAAADAERELNMLGVLASSGFDQVLLVTHSDLADAYASQVIQL